MNIKALEAFAKEAAKTLKTEKDLSDFSRMLKKVTVEAALGADLDEHLGYDKNQPRGRCWVSPDGISFRSYPLFRAQEILEELIASLQGAQE